MRPNLCRSVALKVGTENGETAILWLGGSVSPALLQDLYGIDDLKDIDTRMVSLRNLLERAHSRHRPPSLIYLLFSPSKSARSCKNSIGCNGIGIYTS